MLDEEKFVAVDKLYSGAFQMTIAILEIVRVRQKSARNKGVSVAPLLRAGFCTKQACEAARQNQAGLPVKVAVVK